MIKMDSQTILNIINILAVLLSPIVALLISNKVQTNKARRQEKIQILKILMTQRFSVKNIDHVNALNLIDVVFIDSKKVREAYKDLYTVYGSKYDNNNENEVRDYCEKAKKAETKLIEAIINDLGYKDKITWDAIQEPYIPQWLSDEIVARTEINNAQTHIANYIKTTLTPQNKIENKQKANNGNKDE